MHETHKIRFSDSSLYDYVCTVCGVTDNQDACKQPCRGQAFKVDEVGVALSVVSILRTPRVTGERIGIMLQGLLETVTVGTDVPVSLVTEVASWRTWASEHNAFECRQAANRIMDLLVKNGYL